MGHPSLWYNTPRTPSRSLPRVLFVLGSCAPRARRVLLQHYEAEYRRQFCLRRSPLCQPNRQTIDEKRADQLFKSFEGKLRKTDSECFCTELNRFKSRIKRNGNCSIYVILPKQI